MEGVGRVADGGVWVAVVGGGGGGGAVGGVWEGGEGRSDIAPQGAPFLIAPLASVYLIRHDQQNRGGERRWGGGGWRGRGPGIDGAGQTGSNFSATPPEPARHRVTHLEQRRQSIVF